MQVLVQVLNGVVPAKEIITTVCTIRGSLRRYGNNISLVTQCNKVEIREMISYQCDRRQCYAH